ncbi:hypothetical protein RBS60_15275 [Sinomonas sp. ASV486]|uniref:hypothetical protein n=1 Tax=Sinomonas sp. ASV486 TaxID=3051170 RepID=UPI0027DB24F2|nr:hypothetical protein [Sinomonas sp. ASV486]MDQ4491562.1 hypothetical protein [Sinomonas sp. ASV486]
MKHKHTLRLLAAAAAVAAATALGSAAGWADSPPTITCGVTQQGPCSQTVHFSSQQGATTPVGTPTNSSTCPDWFINDIGFLDFSGNGVAHVNVDKAQDFWTTSTFTGTGTLTLYSPQNVIFWPDGSITPKGSPDQILTGHLTDWFGISANVSSAVVTGTVDITGTLASGSSLGVHYASHMNWNRGAIPFVDPAVVSFNKVSCN